MKIAIFGLGYVGSVSAACLARDGHQVVGMDIDQGKVEAIRAGNPPIVEPMLASIISQAHENGSLSAVDETITAIENSDLAMICVGTPEKDNGDVSLGYLHQACCEIGAALRELDKTSYTIVIRSTIKPNTTNDLVKNTIEQQAGGKKFGNELHLAFNPEFLREGSAVYDYDNPPKIVIGSDDAVATQQLTRLYAHIDAKIIHTSIEVAELVKYVDNCWHGLKVAFANEVGTIAKALNIDSYAVMDIFIQDTKLNLSPYYLRPGAPFGGSCLAKDIKALNYISATQSLQLPLLEHIIASNDSHLERIYQQIIAYDVTNITFLGFSFKAKTDDLRESPTAKLISKLRSVDKKIKIFDNNIHISRLRDANRAYILENIYDFSSMICSCGEEAMANAELVVISYGDDNFDDLLTKLGQGQQVLDLSGAYKSDAFMQQDWYAGSCW
jgi:GDP-mannose 6-dehydrogenase